jgi:hypothetical protein
MSISESIVSILEKLSTLKIAAPAALASFILLIPTFIWLLLLKSKQIFQARSSVTFSEFISKLISIFATNTPPELSATATILSIVFVASLSFLVVNFIRDIKDTLKQLNAEAGKSLKRLVIHEKRQIAQAKRLKYILGTITDDNVNIIKQYHHEKNLIELDHDRIIAAADLIEKYKIIEMVSGSRNNTKYFRPKNNTQYFRLNIKYDLFVRMFVDEKLNKWILNKEDIVNSLSFLMVIHSVFSSLFDVIYYAIVAIVFTFIAIYCIAIALSIVFAMFSAV